MKAATQRVIPLSITPKKTIPTQAKYAAASRQINWLARRTGHNASPIMTAALAYQTNCIGQIAALPRPNTVVRNTFSGSCSTGWTMKSTYMTMAATTAAARPIRSMENCRSVLAPCGPPPSPWVSRSGLGVDRSDALQRMLSLSW